MTALETLYELYTRRDALTLQKQDAITLAMLPVQAEIDAITAAYAESEQATAAQIAELEASVKADALQVGATIKGSHLMVVWSKGRTTWDSAKLDGMASLIPQLNDARKVGEPTVSIRKVG